MSISLIYNEISFVNKTHTDGVCFYIFNPRYLKGSFLAHPIRSLRKVMEVMAHVE